MNLVGVIFEKGLKLSRAIDGALYFPSVPGREKSSSPKEVASEFGVRPVVAIYHEPAGPERATILPTETGKETLEIQLSQLDQIAITKHIRSFAQTSNMIYLVGAVLYHCRRLAELYGGIAAEFANTPFPHESDHVTYGNQAEPYSELEALITATIRAYDSTRYILWHSFWPGGGSVPKSFTRAIEPLSASN